LPTVRDFIWRDIITTDKATSAFELSKMLRERKRYSAIIMEADKPVGIVTDHDLLDKVMAEGKDPKLVKAMDIMSSPLFSIEPNASLKDAARLMNEKGIRRLPVVEKGQLLGLVAVEDLARSLGRKSFAEEVFEAMAKYPPYPM
jgi:malate dehydrogenase (oxaloacetate-decarboxylating)